VNCIINMRRPAALLASLGALSACGVSTRSDEVNVIEVLPAVGYFDPCDFDDQCPIDASCHDIEIDYGNVIVVDAMCTVACGSDFDCPPDGICLGASSGPPLCYQLCFDDFDCPVGFGCVQDADQITFEPVCMPI
jgi:hypothetical protein